MPRTAKDVMTADPAFCTPETSVEDAAKLMVQHQCGEIPVVESHASLEPIGVVTDYHNRTLQDIVAAEAGIVLFVRALPSLKKGDTIVSIGVVKKRE